MMKQKTNPPEDEKKPKKGDDPSSDQKLKEAADKGKDLLSRMEEATKPKEKKGRWTSCCGVRVWVED